MTGINMYDDISENDLSYEEKTTNADGTPAAYLPKFGGRQPLPACKAGAAEPVLQRRAHHRP